MEKVVHECVEKKMEEKTSNEEEDGNAVSADGTETVAEASSSGQAEVLGKE